MPGTKNSRDLQIVDPVLSNIARAFQPKGFVYDKVFPTITVNEDSGKYPVFTGFFDDDTDPKVPDRASTPEIDFTWSTESYYCEDYRLKASITRKEERNAHSALKLRQNKLRAVLTRMAIRRERRAAELLRKTSNGGGLNLGAAPGTNWDQDAATIEADIKTGSLAVYDATGMTTNAMIVPFKVAYAMAVQQDIREIIKYTVPGDRILIEGDRVLPKVLHGHEVIIPKGAMRNTAAEGATVSLSDIWADHVRLVHLPEAADDWGVPSTGYSFKAEPEVVDRWKANDPPVEYVRAWECVDEKIVGADLGYEIASVLS